MCSGGVRKSGRKKSSRKRGVRLLIHQLREDFGVPILPSGQGYYLGTEPADFEAARDFCRRNGLPDLALGSKLQRHPEAATAAGQLFLFA